MTTEVKLDRTYTVNEFMDLEEDGYVYELVRGRLQPMSPTGEEHGRIASLLNIHVGSYVLLHALGETYAAETAFVLNAATNDARAADFAFVAAPRRIMTQDAIPVLPDLVAEVISKSDRLIAVRKKVAEYQRAGIRLIWVVNPRDRTIAVYHPADTQPVTLGIDDQLDGEEVVPGFALPVRALFELH